MSRICSVWKWGDRGQGVEVAQTMYTHTLNKCMNNKKNIEQNEMKKNLSHKLIFLRSILLIWVAIFFSPSMANTFFSNL
jgi:hypothetical protein